MKKQIIRFLPFCLLFILFILPTHTNAQALIFNENFSADLSQWQPIRDDGRYWIIHNGALEATVPSGSTITELVPVDSAWKNTDSYVLDLDYTAIQGADKNIGFGVIDKKNWYEIHFTPSASYVVKVKNGSVIWQENFAYVLPSGVLHKLSIIFIKGKIHLLINGTQVFEATDPTFTTSQGKISVKATTGSIFPTKIRIDNIVVREIQDTPQVDGTQLEVPLLKQDDERWSHVEYDTARTWATALQTGNTIKDWGCNLLSQVMILQYHGIIKLPDGTSLTPISLNQWLLDNNGFYNNPPSGNIDRKSISRLTADISKIYNTPKLEFLYVGENLLPTAIAEIEKGNPVILELEGHFVVAYGFTEDKTDLLIKDPSYPISKLSEHPLSLKSVRLFTPSFTDLSYISVISSEDIEVSARTMETEIPMLHYFERTRLLSENEESITSPTTQIHEIAKPETGKYLITINNTTSSNQNVSLVTYSSDGTRQQFNLKTQKGESTFILHYSKDGKSFVDHSTSQKLSYKDFRKTIKELANTDQIKRPYFEKVLLQLIKPAERVSVLHQKKLLRVIKIVVGTAPSSLITKAAQALLLDQVGLLLANLR